MAKMAMQSSSIVKHFYVIKQICFGFTSGCVHFSLYTFSLERVEKTFCNSIIQTNVLVCSYSESDYALLGNLDNHRLHIGSLDRYEQLPVLLWVVAILP